MDEQSFFQKANNKLNEKQDYSLRQFKKGKNIFLSGPAGVGKSFMIKKFKEISESIGKNICVTAMTGSAAILINGKTLHSWAGIGLGNDDENALLRKVKLNRHSNKKWKTTDILIIDEVSMLSPELFEKLDFIGKNLRKNLYKPFGGIQLVFVGDFYQLPPIKNSSISSDSSSNSNDTGYKDKLFVFESDLWKHTFDEIIELEDIMRQDDVIFQNILNNIRKGIITKEDKKILKRRTYAKLIKKDPSFNPKNISINGIEPTKLFVKRMDVNVLNNKKLSCLNNTIKKFEPNTSIVYYGESNEKKYNETQKNYIISQMDNSGCYEKDLNICIGAQVMLSVNLDFKNKLVNGSRGIVIDFDNATGYPIVKFTNNIEMKIERFDFQYEDDNGCIYRSQVPLKLAWCMTIHKSQGMSIDLAEIDVGSNIFEFGQTYVALSRVRTIDGLYLIDLNTKKIKAHPKVIDFYDKVNKKEIDVSTEPKNSIRQFFLKGAIERANIMKKN